MGEELSKLGLTRALVVLVAIAAVGTWQPPIASAATLEITVDSNGRGSDVDIDGRCATAGGACTLRAAIEEANAKGNVNIRFDLPEGQRTIVDEDLPVVTAPNVNIDATTAPSYSGTPLVVLTNESSKIPLLTIAADHSTVKGLRFRGTGASAGVWVKAASRSTVVSDNYFGGAVGDGLNNGVVDEGSSTLVSNNVFTRNVTGVLAAKTSKGIHLTGNVMGTNHLGTSGLGNLTAIAIEDGATEAVIGGSEEAKRNVIAGNTATGVRVSAARASVFGNWFGLAKDGQTKVTNQNGLLAEDGAQLVIGGTGEGQANVFLVSGAFHVNIGSGATARVQGNYFGTTKSGAVEGSAPTAVQVTSKQGGSVIGGDQVGEANVIVNSVNRVDVVKGAIAEVGTNSEVKVAAKGQPRVGSNVSPVMGGDGQVIDELGNVSFVASSAKGTVAIAATPTGLGSYSVTSDGRVYVEGDARHFGSMGGRSLNAPITGVVPTPTGGGYFLTAADGGVFAFGDATFAGSMAQDKLAKPVRTVVPNCEGSSGYWLLAEDGGVFAFGGAQYLGSLSGKSLSATARSLVPNCSGGYWIVTSDGGVFAFGNAAFLGSVAANPPRGGVAGLVPFRNGKGYWLVDRVGSQAHAFGPPN